MNIARGTFEAVVAEVFVELIIGVITKVVKQPIKIITHITSIVQ